MKSPSWNGFALSMCAAGAMLVRCGGPQLQAGATTPPPVGGALAYRGTTPSWIAPVTKDHLIYVADGGKVWIFPEKRNSPPIASITDGITAANGLYVDKHRSLYVANYVFDNSTVTVYPEGSLTPSATISDRLDDPLYMVVDGNGNLFVSNAGNGTVVEYLSGSISAYRVLQTGGTEADGIDFDRHGNLYVAYRYGNVSGGIDKFEAGSTHGNDLGIHLIQPQGLSVADDGTILVTETGEASRIDEFLPGAKRAKLKVAVPQTPVELAITKREKRLFISTLGGAVYVTPYPLKQPDLCQEVFGGYATQGVALSNGHYF